MKDISGKRFGRLVAIKPVGINEWGNYLWECRCDCGNTHTVAQGKLQQKKSRSCGCYRRETSTKSLETHGITTGGKPRTFTIWNGMKLRCFNKGSASYKSYGARGIAVCKEWMKFETFHNWAMANGYKDKLTIDRIDNNGNYEPGNCRWVSSISNKKRQRNTRYISIKGVTRNVSEWCRIFDISKTVAYKYLNVSDEAFIYFINKFLASEIVEVS